MKLSSQMVAHIWPRPTFLYVTAHVRYYSAWLVQLVTCISSFRFSRPESSATDVEAATTFVITIRVTIFISILSWGKVLQLC